MNPLFFWVGFEKPKILRKGNSRMSWWNLVRILSKLGCFTYLGDVSNLLISGWNNLPAGHPRSCDPFFLPFHVLYKEVLSGIYPFFHWWATFQRFFQETFWRVNFFLCKDVHLQNFGWVIYVLMKKKSQTTTVWMGAKTRVIHGISTTNLNWLASRISGCHQKDWFGLCCSPS